MTLIETLFAIGIMGVVSTAIYQLVTVHHTNYRFQQSMMDLQQTGRIALSTLAREIRWIGYGLLDTEPSDIADHRSCHPWVSTRFLEVVDGHGIRFLSNLHGIHTALAKDALPGDTELVIPDDPSIQENGLSVSKGEAFERNDTIYIYHPTVLDGRNGVPMAQYLECHKLASKGISGRIRLALEDPIRRQFPAGSQIHVVNELYYFLDSDRQRLMRRLDGGTEALVEGVEDVLFREDGNKLFIQLTLKATGLQNKDYKKTVETAVALRNR
jgi:hypothetical protein